MRVASDISAGKGFTSRALLGCFALAGASHSTLEHAPLHHLTLDIVQPGQKLLQFHLSRASKLCQLAPGEIWVEVLPVNHVQGWVELVCSNCDTARGWDKPMNEFYKTYKIKFPLPVNCVSLHMTGLGPLQLHLHVWLGQTLVRGQMASRPENRGDFFISPKNSRPDLTTGVHFYHKTLGAKYLIQIHVSSTIQEDIRCIIMTNMYLSTNL